MRAFALFTTVALALSACKRTSDEAVPHPDGPASAQPALSTTPTASASASPPPPAAAAELPMLVPQPALPGGARVLDEVEGALAVSDGERVGRIVGDQIEWLDAKLPQSKSRHSSARIRIFSVNGRWPDALGVVSESDFGRAPELSYFPLTGKGVAQEASPGGNNGSIEVFQVGESTVGFFKDYGFTYRFQTLRGPTVERGYTSWGQAGCKGREDVHNAVHWPAIRGHFAGTPSGTLLSVGDLCDDSARRAAEIWDKAGNSRIVELPGKGRGGVVRGVGDELWLPGDPLLRYENGKFEPWKGPGPAVPQYFASATGQLHASAGRALWRHQGGTWVAIARLPWPMSFRLALHEGAFWFVDREGIRKLGPGEGTALREGCKTHFVHLSDVSYSTPERYHFPATQKALSTFADAKDLTLLEFSEAGRRRLGVAVSSKAQGEALVAHAKAAMPEDDPALLCFQPKTPLRIEPKKP